MRSILLKGINIDVEFLKQKKIYKNSEYDQEIPQLQSAVKPTAPRGRATQQSRDTRKTN